MAPRRPTILVVTEDPEASQAMSSWLREAGLRVVTCPGPRPPSYVCAGECGDPCPLALSAELVVLDLWLASDTMQQGTPAMQLLSYYQDLGKPVVALQRLGGAPGPFAGEGVELTHWPPTRRSLLDAVHRRLPGSQAHALQDP
jgi:CheY-like chemotaxis protein